MSTVALMVKYATQVVAFKHFCERNTNKDLDDADWHSLSLGFLIALGVVVPGNDPYRDAFDLARHIRYELGYWG